MVVMGCAGWPGWRTQGLRAGVKELGSEWVPEWGSTWPNFDLPGCQLVLKVWRSGLEPAWWASLPSLKTSYDRRLNTRKLSRETETAGSAAFLDCISESGTGTRFSFEFAVSFNRAGTGSLPLNKAPVECFLKTDPGYMKNIENERQSLKTARMAGLENASIHTHLLDL